MPAFGLFAHPTQFPNQIHFPMVNSPMPQSAHSQNPDSLPETTTNRTNDVSSRSTTYIPNIVQSSHDDSADHPSKPRLNKMSEKGGEKRSPDPKRRFRVGNVEQSSVTRTRVHSPQFNSTEPPAVRPVRNLESHVDQPPNEDSLPQLIDLKNIHTLPPFPEAVLSIIEQPYQFGRFRYQAEGRENPLEGQQAGSFPTIGVKPEFAHLVPPGALIHPRLLLRFGDENGRCIEHYHTLIGKDSQPIARPLVNGMCVFDNLVVQRQRSQEKRAISDQRSVRIGFSVIFHFERTLYVSEVISVPIFNADLKIDYISHSTCPVDGADIVVLCSKVRLRMKCIVEKSLSSRKNKRENKFQLIFICIILP